MIIRRNYHIVDCIGNIYAHDITNMKKARLKLNDIKKSLEETMTKKEIKQLEIEIIY